MQKGLLPLSRDSGSPYVQKMLDAYPSPYFLAIFPEENRVHVVTQLKRYSNDLDEEGSMAGHLVAYMGEVNIVSGLPPLVGLPSTDKCPMLNGVAWE